MTEVISKVSGAATICVAVIVEQESHTLPDCLRSVVDVATHALIMHANETDPTVNVAMDMFERLKLSGECIHYKFDDFADAKNTLLKMAKERGYDYVLYLDADERLEVETTMIDLSTKLLWVIDKKTPVEINGLLEVPIITRDSLFRQVRIIHTGASVEWVLPVAEVPYSPIHDPRPFSGIRIRNTQRGRRQAVPAPLDDIEKLLPFLNGDELNMELLPPWLEPDMRLNIRDHIWFHLARWSTRHEEARPYYYKIYKNSPDSHYIYETMYELYYMDYPNATGGEALELIERLSALCLLYPNRYEAFNRLARILRHSGGNNLLKLLGRNMIKPHAYSEASSGIIDRLAYIELLDCLFDSELRTGSWADASTYYHKLIEYDDKQNILTPEQRQDRSHKLMHYVSTRR